MSTKFNRNDVNAADDKFYIDDYKADLNGVEQDNFEDTQDFEDIPCIVSGLTLTPVAYPSTNVIVAAGTARDKNGKRINVPEEQIVQITDTVGGNNYIILSHKYSVDTPRKAYETGTEYNTRKYDDFELTVASSYSADDIVLGNVKVVGAQNLLYLEERTHPVYKPQSGDTTAPTDPSNLVLTSGIMGDDDIPIYDGTKYVDRAERLAWLKADWDPSADYGSGLAGYEIFLIPLNAADIEQIDKRETRKVRYSTSDPRSDITFQNLTTGIKYRIKIRAVDKAGNLSNFIQADIIAGGAKQIPESCADVLDGDPTITPADDGIRISWSVLLAYQEKVVGFEFCWTDDETAPDFGNKNHRQVFTKQNSIVLPAKLSSEDDTVVVKMKMRAVDRTYQHCTTPKTLTDTNAKKYPADIAAIVTDRKSILTPGNFPTLKAFLEKSVTLSDGMPKGITAVESEMADARGTHSTVGARITAILGAGVDWKYVRIVAKDDTGHFSTIQAAVDSIPANNSNVSWLIYIMPGVYIENINLNRSQSNNMSISFIGLGRVVIKGRIYNSAETSYTSIAIRKLVNIHFYREIGASGHTLRLKGLGIASTFIRNCQFYNVSNNCKDIYIPHGIESLILEHCNFNITNHNALHLVGYSTSKIKIRNTELYAGGINNIYIEGQGVDCNVYVEHCALRTGGSTPCVDGDANPSTNKLYINHCKYVTAPNATNLTIDYGTADNQTNVLFDDGDFWADGMIIDTLE